MSDDDLTPNALARIQSFGSGCARGVEFWGRATTIYAAYKLTQLRAAAAAGIQHKDAATIRQELWVPQHEWAGDAMYDMCISLRGFYLKAGQFIGSRGDFVPEQICRRLALLCDKVPPMTTEETRRVLMRELGTQDLADVFEWINLEEPIGSASISQVHKAKLRSFPADQVRAAGQALKVVHGTHVLRAGEGAWDVCNLNAVSMDELAKLNKGIRLDRPMPAGQVLHIPVLQGLAFLAPPAAAAAPPTPAGGTQVAAAVVGGPAAAVLHAAASGTAPEDGIVAVKIQYPGALAVMTGDLGNLRSAAYFLSKTEIAFDLVSAIDELNKQIKLEFDFIREARVMDTIAHQLRGIRHHVSIPRSVPGLVTKRLLVMNFMPGTPLLEASKRMKEISEFKRVQGSKRILSRISEAYGRMMLETGLFQADGHPGNIFVQSGGRVALLDYGQSKQLPDDLRLNFARLILRLDKGSKTDKHSHPGISSVLGDMGVVTSQDNVSLRADMAYGMFDTRGKADPFDPDSPIKQCAISTFPPDLFFVLRVVQLLRGMANGMGVKDFSCAEQWSPYAREALRKAGCRADGKVGRSSGSFLGLGALLPFGRR